MEIIAGLESRTTSCSRHVINCVVAHLSFTARKLRGSMQLTLQFPLPTSLQMEAEKRPKLARTTLMREPSSHTMLSWEPSQPYFVRR